MAKRIDKPRLTLTPYTMDLQQWIVSDDALILLVDGGFHNHIDESELILQCQEAEAFGGQHSSVWVQLVH